MSDFETRTPSGHPRGAQTSRSGGKALYWGIGLVLVLLAGLLAIGAGDDPATAPDGAPADATLPADPPQPDPELTPPQ